MQLKSTQLTYKNTSVDILVEYRTTPSPSSFFKKYNIISNKDGSIYDLDLKCMFDCMYNWADAIQRE